MATQTGSTYISDSVTDVVEIPTWVGIKIVVDPYIVLLFLRASLSLGVKKWVFDHIEIEQSVPIQAILSVIGNRCN